MKGHEQMDSIKRDLNDVDVCQLEKDAKKQLSLTDERVDVDW